MEQQNYASHRNFTQPLLVMVETFRRSIYDTGRPRHAQDYFCVHQLTQHTSRRLNNVIIVNKLYTLQYNKTIQNKANSDTISIAFGIIHPALEARPQSVKEKSNQCKSEYPSNMHKMFACIPRGYPECFKGTSLTLGSGPWMLS